ncbi:hypothetical protein ADUPG1_011691, partial [Aduncisulcus paluster]
IEECSAWVHGHIDDTYSVGIMTFADDMPLTSMAYNPMMVVSFTFINFTVDFRSSLKSRFLLMLAPGGSVPDKSRQVEAVINREIAICDGMKVWNKDRQEEMTLHVFHFCHKADSPQRHDHLRIPKPSGLCRYKCNLCSCDRDNLTSNREFPERDDLHMPFATFPLPPDILHMEGRTMLKIVLPLFVSCFQRKDNYMEILIALKAYKCGLNISLLHSVSFNAHQFYELCYVLPALSSIFHARDCFKKAAQTRAEYQELIFRNYKKWHQNKITTIEKVVKLMRRNRKHLLECGMSGTALCQHIFPAHFHHLMMWYGTIQNIDTDLDERLNGFITPYSTSHSSKSLKSLGINVQNALRDVIPTVFEQLGPRDQLWRPSKGVWCAVKDANGDFFFVKIIERSDLPATVEEITHDVLLDVWEESEDDSYSVEAQGSLWAEVRVFENRLLRYHPLNQFYFQ